MHVFEKSVSISLETSVSQFTNSSNYILQWLLSYDMKSRMYPARHRYIMLMPETGFFGRDI